MEEINIIQNANTIKGYLDGTIKCPDDKLKNATINSYLNAIIDSAKKIQDKNVELKDKLFDIANLL